MFLPINRYKIHWQMAQIKHCHKKCLIFNIQDVQIGHGGTKYLVPPSKKIIVNQSKPVLVIVSIKPFTCQSFRQNYFLREIEWTVLIETAS